MITPMTMRMSGNQPGKIIAKKIADITGLNAEAERARERVIAHIEKVQRVAARMARSAEPANA